MNNILVINTVPYFFPQSWVSETYTLGSTVQYASNKQRSMVVTPSDRSTSLSIDIPIGGKRENMHYCVAKQVIRLTTLMFSTSRVKMKDGEITDVEDLHIVGGKALFSKVKLPSGMVASCGYFGKTVHLACCAIVSFSTSFSPDRSVETWEMNLVEYHFRRTEEEKEETKRVQQDVKRYVSGKDEEKRVRSFYERSILAKREESRKRIQDLTQGVVE